MAAPVTLFTYCRAKHTRRTVESLLKNPLALETDLIVYSDAARTLEQEAAVNAVRAYVASITGFRSITIKHRAVNFGLAKSIIAGVTEVLQHSDRVIVLEDDMVTSAHFLSYMNEALERYAAEDRVASIHGYVYPVDQPLPEAFFLRGADCWGWATWRRAWAHFNPDGRLLLDELKHRKLLRAFDYNGTYPFSEMLHDQIEGKNDSWAIRWNASAFLAGKLTLYPGRSLVHNIGNDNSGTHCGETARFDSLLSDTPIDLNNVEIEASQVGWRAFERFFQETQSGRRQLAPKNISATGMKEIKAIAKNWLPPVVLNWARKIVHKKQGEPIQFDGDFATWAEARVQCGGYAAENILSKVLDATLKVKRGEAAFERDSVVFDEIEYSWPLLAALMLAAARNFGKLNVLDFGGALGSTYFQHRKFLQALPEVLWNVVEQSHYVEAGIARIQDTQLRFFKTVEECLDENQPNVIVLSSVLQYIESPIDVIKQLSSSGATYLLIDRTPFSSDSDDKILIQRVPPSIYTASYPIRVSSSRKFIRMLAADWHLVASNLSVEGRVNTSTGFEFTFQGMLLERRQ